MKLTLKLLLLFSLPCWAEATDYQVTTNNYEITITGYVGSGGAITIPESISGFPVTAIGNYAFAGFSSLTRISIPSTIISIGEASIYGCKNLTEISVAPSNPVFKSVNGVLFNKNLTTLIQHPSGKAGNYSIPEGVLNIEFHSFSNNEYISGITIPSSVTTIGYGAFLACPNLNAITVSVENSGFSGLDGVLFNKNQATLIQCPGGKSGSYNIPDTTITIGKSALSGCSKLTNINIPHSVKTIDREAFSYCHGLTHIEIPDNVTTIGSSAFSPCDNLSSVKLPAEITLIPDGLFSFCISLEKITIPAKVAEIQIHAFFYCNNLSEVYFEGNEPVVNSHIFSGLEKTIYYKTGTTGWSSTFESFPTVEWYSELEINSISIGPNKHSFLINGPENHVVVVDSCTDLNNPTWVSEQTNTLLLGSHLFECEIWTNLPQCFYRVRNL